MTSLPHPVPPGLPPNAGSVALLFNSRWLEAPVVASFGQVGLAATRYGDVAALIAAMHQTRIDIALIEDVGNHFLHTMTTLRFRGSATVPIVAVGRGTSHEIGRALQQGAADYAVLGESMALLVHRTQARLMIDAQVRAPTTLRAGGCWLEASSRTLQFSSGESALTPREFALAWVLFEHAGQVVSMQALAQHVWGREVDISKRTIEQHVSRLRAKLAAAGVDEAVSLQAIHNVGYRLLVTRRSSPRRSTGSQQEAAPVA